MTGLITIDIGIIVWTFAHIHTEHDDLGRHGAHLIGEAILVYSIHMSGKRVLAIGFAFTLMDHFAIGTFNSNIDIQETAFSHLKHQTHFGAHLDLVEKTFFGMSIHLRKDNDMKGFDVFISFHRFEFCMFELEFETKC